MYVGRVVDILPAAHHLKLDPQRVRIWRVEYNWKTELHGWQPGPPFCLPRAADKPVEGIAVVMAAAAHPSAIGIELTAVKLQSPLSAEES
jgi:hypothetical protein